MLQRGLLLEAKGKNALFRQSKLFFGGPLSEIKESVGGAMSFRACPLLADGPPRFSAEVWTDLKSRDMGYVEARFLPWVCHCIVSTDGAASMSGTAAALFQPLPKKPRLRCLRADFLCGASAAGSCCGCKKTPYLGQIARNLSFAAAWIASRGHGK